MTVQEAIAQLDALKQNDYTAEDKLRWLSRLDGTVKLDIYDTHEGSQTGMFSPYAMSDFGKTLLIPNPFDDVYLKYMVAQIDWLNGDYSRYNITATAFNSAYNAFAEYYTRTHMPKQRSYIQAR